MTFDEALRQYGIDKPDMRLPALTEVSATFTPEQLETLAIVGGLPIVAVRIPAVGDLSRKERDDLRLVYPPKLAANGVKVMDDFKRLEKSFPETIKVIREKIGAGEQDLIVLVVADSKVRFGEGEEGNRPPTGEEGSGYRHGGGEQGNVPDRASVVTGRERTLYEMAGQVRLALAQKFADRHKAFEKKGTAEDYKFLWVTDFPFFEWDEETKTWGAAHHPFTSPHEDDLKAGRLSADPGAVRALAYDIVLNGTELGSGSIRIHRQDVQSQIFSALGMTDEEARKRFGYFLEAHGIRCAAARRHCARSGPHCDDPRWRAEPARGDRLPQDGQGHRPDGECAGACPRHAVERTAYPARVEELDSASSLEKQKPGSDAGLFASWRLRLTS